MVGDGVKLLTFKQALSRLCPLKVGDTIPYWWPFCPCLRSPLGTASCAYLNMIF